jgi:hypothetical protein
LKLQLDLKNRNSGATSRRFKPGWCMFESVQKFRYSEDSA